MWTLPSIAAIAIASALQAQPGEFLFNAQGYRIAHYRAPTRRPPEGVIRIAPSAAAQMRPDVDALFIDVLPAEGGHREVEGGWRLVSEHRSIAGSHWFPESGRGVVASDIEQWFVQGIARLTKGRRDMPIIVFCLADCWMSWNAARRLAAMGYVRVWWLAEGTDGWSDLGKPLVPLLPEGVVVP